MTCYQSDQTGFSWFRVITTTAITLVCLIAAIATGLRIYKLSNEPPSFPLLTSALPACNRVAIEAVQGSETDIVKVQGTKTLVATEASNFETIWRSQPFIDGLGDLCHSPIYRIRFYRNEAVFAEATICFECNNVYFIDHPTGTASYVFREISFNAATVESKKLRSYLANLFPGHDPAASKP